MQRLPSLARLVLGGFICGGLAGVFLGAVIGFAAGVVADDTSLGLDGAIIGQLLGACAGGIWALFLAVHGDACVEPTSSSSLASQATTAHAPTPSTESSSQQPAPAR